MPVIGQGRGAAANDAGSDDESCKQEPLHQMDIGWRRHCKLKIEKCKLKICLTATLHDTRCQLNFAICIFQFSICNSLSLIESQYRAGRHWTRRWHKPWRCFSH